MTTSNHWSTTKERGSLLGMRILLALYNYGGKYLVKLVLYPVVAYFFISGTEARVASQDYFSKLHQAGYLKKKPGLGDSFKHFMTMANSALDKVDVWLGKITIKDINYNVFESFNTLIKAKKGALIIGSHLGNLEVCRALSSVHTDLVFNILVFTENAQKFNDFLNTINPDVKVNLIETRELGPGLAIALKDKIDQGEYVVIAGDRTSTSVQGRVIHADFIGHSAPFSQGPFILAALMQCPIFMMFCLKNTNKFELIFEPLSEQVNWSRKTRTQELEILVQKFAKTLEQYCAQYPYQWFNFFNYWQSDSASRSNQH